MQNVDRAIKILLIEDNRADTQLLKQFFAKLGKKKIELIAVERLRDGLNYLQQNNNFDIILLDLSLPDGWGLENLAKIQQVSAEIPVIILTGVDDEEQALAALRAGAQDYIIKSQIFGSLLLRAINYAIERKQAEREKARLIASLHESEERFRTLANTAPVLMWMTDADGQCSFFNQSWLEFTGCSLEQELVNGWLANIYPEERHQCLSLYKFALQNRSRFQMEYRLLHADGAYRWVLNTGVPRFTNSGKFAGFICSCVDITERKQAEELLAQQAHRDRILAEITQRIHESLDLEVILSTAVEKINQFLSVDKIMITKVDSPNRSQILFESDNSQTTNNCEVNNACHRNMFGLPKNFEQLQQGKVVVLEQVDPSAENSISLQQKFEGCSVLLVPIINEKKLWGLLSAEQYTQPRQWQTGEIELLQQIAVQLAIAIHQSELYQQLEKANQELEKLAEIDSLTGIANRRKFDECIAREWLRLARERVHLSLILCDIDHFKLYNDTYGHQAGDRCLKQVSQAIAKAIKRPADLAARYGGEELAIILPNTTPEGAEKLARQICLKVEALQIPHLNSPINMYVTLSVGVAGCIPRHESSPQALISAADRALYQAKEAGRNRVVRSQGSNQNRKHLSTNPSRALPSNALVPSTSKQSSASS
ncbi:diguanylate cyclase [Pleurocapsales cyanobacterium LEGE 06147]|nr:diguanylate cyclase [Pleurocapsales cyanobacterium LEGE 06147]